MLSASFWIAGFWKEASCKQHAEIKTHHGVVIRTLTELHTSRSGSTDVDSKILQDTHQYCEPTSNHPEDEPEEGLRD